MSNVTGDNNEKWYSGVFVLVVLTLFALQLLGTNLSLAAIDGDFWRRTELIGAYNNFRLSLGDRVFPTVLVGKDGWLFFTGDFTIPDYQKTDPINRSNLKRLAAILNKLDKKMKEHGGILILAIPPDKSAIYPQYMPDEIPVIGTISRLDQTLEFVRENTHVRVVDLRPALLDASQSTQVYYKTDSHWNCYGAFYAYREIFSEVAKTYPNAKVYSLEDFNKAGTKKKLMDISPLLALTFKEELFTLAPKIPFHLKETPAAYPMAKMVVNSQGGLPSGLALHDSFYANCLDRFIEPSFSRTLSLNSAVSNVDEFTKIIGAEKPDVLIVEFAERQIEYFVREVGGE
jgi:hypothetical protein